ncbi:MAG: hypothetical protein AABY22_07490, partial [Nanoarchaeota archaeon]
MCLCRCKNDDVSQWTNKIHLGNCIELAKQLPNESVDCVVTSPPYWGLRSYKTEPQIWGGN